MLRLTLGYTSPMSLINDNQNLVLKEKLLKAYMQKKVSNQAYSLRAFGQKLGVSSGALSEILSDKRRPTLKTALKILKNMHADLGEISAFREIDGIDINQEKVQRNYFDLGLDQYQILSHWAYFAFLNLIELPQTIHNVNYFAKALKVEKSFVEEMIERLGRLEMIEKVDGRYVRTQVRYQTTEDVANSAIKHYHYQTLEKSEEALTSIEPELRDFSSILLKVNPKNIKKVKEMIRQFQDQISEMVEEDDPSEVYHLNVHLYPVTNAQAAIQNKKQQQQQTQLSTRGESL